MKNEAILEKLTEATLALGAYKASVIDAAIVETDRAFRDMCASNACGMYGRCYMCPPDVGDIEALMSELKRYEYALVYQTVAELEDSYDFEGMIEAKKKHAEISKKMRDVFNNASISEPLHLSVGGCYVCEKCAKMTGEPCRAPELAMASLEAYGVNVSRLAALSGMKYVNGADTVTYFGAVFFDLGA